MTRDYSESPVYFEAAGEWLFGVITNPGAGAPTENLLAMCAAGWIPSWHRGRMWVRLARTMAQDGVRTFRFDYRGVGESTGIAEFALQRPFVPDAAAALDLVEAGSEVPTYIVGTCFGARTAAALAATSARPAGLVFLAVPVRNAMSNREVLRQAASTRIVKNLFKPDHRAHYLKVVRRRLKLVRSYFRRRMAPTATREHDFVEDLQAIVNRRIPCLMVYGEEDREYEWFLEAVRLGRLGHVLKSAGDLVEVRQVPGRFHGFASDQAQNLAIEVVKDWILSRRPQGSP